MIVFFEDGAIANRSLVIDGGETIKVDAGAGYSACRRQLRSIDTNLPFDTKVYTNSLDAFSNFWCWDEQKKMPMIYIRDNANRWALISTLTTRQLRVAQNLEKLYVNGEFGNMEGDS